MLRKSPNNVAHGPQLGKLSAKPEQQIVDPWLPPNQRTIALGTDAKDAVLATITRQMASPVVNLRDLCPDPVFAPKFSDKRTTGTRSVNLFLSGVASLSLPLPAHR